MGGSRPHSLRQGGGLVPLSKKEKYRMSYSIRKSFRAGGKPIKLGENKDIIPCAIACRRDEHKEFISFGAEFMVPDFNHLDVATLRNFILLYREGICHISTTVDKNKQIVKNVHLQNEEPCWGPNMRDYYATKLPDDICPHKEDPTPDLASIDLIKRILKKYGGSLSSMNKVSAHMSPNMTPHIVRQNGKFSVNLMEMQEAKAIHTCANCNTLNLVWLEDVTTGVKGQHCGICFCELDLKRTIPDHIVCGFVEIEDTTQIGVGAIELEMLKTTNNTDGSIDLTASTRNTLVNQDLRNARAALSRRLYKIVTVNNGLTSDQLFYLCQNNISFTLVQSRSTPNPHAMLASERKLAWYNFVERAATNQLVIDVGARYNRDNYHCTTWHGIGPCLDWRDIERYGSKPLEPNTCSHTLKTCNCSFPNNPLIVSIDSLYDVAAQEVVGFMKRTGAKYLLFCLSTAAIDFTSAQGALLYNQGEWCRNGNSLVTSLIGDDKPYVNNWYLSKMWTTADEIHVGDDVVNIKTYSIIGNHILRIVTLNELSNVLKKQKLSTQQSEQMVTMEIPLIKIDSWLSSIHLPILVRELVTIDVGLYQTLYARNLTGKLSFEKMVEFGLAYAHSKYTTATTTFHQKHLTANDVRLHAMLATIATRRKYAWVQQAISMNEPTTLLGVDLQAGTVYGTLEYCKSIITEWIGEFLKSSNCTHSKWVARLDKVISEWLDNGFWTELEQLGKTSHKINFIEYRDPVQPTAASTQAAYLCNHHNVSCDHMVPLRDACVCCGIVEVVGDTEHCACCSPNGCKHDCQHMCQGGLYHGPKQDRKVNCECCGVLSNANRCGNCIMTISQNKNQQQPPILQRDLAEKQDDPTRIAKSKVPKPKPVFEKPNVISNTAVMPIKPKKSKAVQAVPELMASATASKTILEKWKMGSIEDNAEENIPLSADKLQPSQQLHQNPDRQYRIKAVEQVTTATRSGEDSGSETGEQQSNEEAITLITDDGEIVVVDPTAGPSEEHANAIWQQQELDRRRQFTLQESELTVEDAATLEVSKLTSVAYASVLRHGWQVSIDSGALRRPDANPANTPGISEYFFAPMGISTIESNLLAVTNVCKVPGDGLCGWHAIHKALGSDANLIDLQQLSGRADWFNNEEIANYLRRLGKNSIMLMPGTSEVNKVDPNSNQYVVIRHAEVVVKDHMHWEPVNVAQLGVGSHFPVFQGCGTGSQLNKLENKYNIPFDWEKSGVLQRMNMAKELIKLNLGVRPLNEQQKCEIQIVEKDGRKWLTNNRRFKHYPKSGLVCFELDRALMDPIEKMVSMETMTARQMLSTEIYNMPKFADADVQEVRLAEVVDTCATIQKIKHEASNLSTLQSESWERFMVTATLMSDKRMRIDITNHKLKSGDLVGVRSPAGMKESYVTVINKNVFLDTPPTGQMKKTVLELFVPKTSYHSKLLRLMALQRPLPKKHIIEQRLLSATAVTGPGGSGKTAKLIDELDENTIVVARTRIAVNTIQTRAPAYRNRIFTYEKLLCDPVHAETLCIDEATMFNWFDVALMLTSDIKKIFLYGDPHQVGLIDSSVLGGDRYLEPVTELAKNKIQLTTTYRFGKTLADILASAGVPIVSAKETDTTVELIKWEQFNDAEFKKLVNKEKPDIILTFYRRNKRELEKLTNTRVETVHAYQSCEADRVLVMQMPTFNSRSQMWVNRSYCISAATRPRERLIWCTVKMQQRTTLANILSGTAVQNLVGGASDETLEEFIMRTGGQVGNEDISEVEEEPYLPTIAHQPVEMTERKWKLIRSPTVEEIVEIANSTLLESYNWKGYGLQELHSASQSVSPENMKWVLCEDCVVCEHPLGKVVFRLIEDDTKITMTCSNRFLSWAAKRQANQLYIEATTKFLENALENDDNCNKWLTSINASMRQIATKLLCNYITQVDSSEEEAESSKTSSCSHSTAGSPDCSHTLPSTGKLSTIAESPSSREASSDGDTDSSTTVRDTQSSALESTELDALQYSDSQEPDFLTASEGAASDDNYNTVSDTDGESTLDESARSSGSQEDTFESMEHDITTVPRRDRETTNIAQSDSEISIENDDRWFNTRTGDEEQLEQQYQENMRVDLVSMEVTTRKTSNRIDTYYPIMTGLLSQYVDMVMCDSMTTTTWHTDGMTQVLESCDIRGKMLEITLTDENMTVVITYDGSGGKLTELIISLIDKWNHAVLVAFRNNDVWQHMTKSQKEILKNRHGMVNPVVRDLGNRKYTLNQLLLEILEKHIDDEGPITMDDIVNRGEMKNKLGKSETNPLYSAINSHHCNEAEAWWNTQDVEMDLVKVSQQTMNKSNNTFIRLLAEQVQMLETCNLHCKLSLWNQSATIKTFGGCSLCCGLSVENEYGVVLKISPQRNWNRRRKFLLNTNNDMTSVNFWSHVIGIESVWNDNVDYSDLPLNRDLLLVEPLRLAEYELGMIFERIGATPKNLYNYVMASHEDHKLCTYYKEINEQYQTKVNAALGTNYVPAATNRMGSHTSADGSLLQFINKSTGRTLLAQLVDNKLQVLKTSLVKINALKINQMLINVANSRMKRMPWRLARMTVKLLKLHNTKFGALEGHDIESLNLPMSYHKAERTGVYVHYREKLEATMLANMKKTFHIVFVHSKQFDKYKDLLKHECQNLPIEKQNFSLVEHGFDQLVEQIHYKYIYNGLSKNSKAIAISDFPYLSMLTSAWATHVRALSQIKNARYVRNLLDTEPLLRKIIQIFGDKKQVKENDGATEDYFNEVHAAAVYQEKYKNGPWFARNCSGPQQKVADLLWIGLTGLKMSPEQLHTTMCNGQYKRVSMLVPVKLNDKNDYFKVVGEDDATYTVAYDESEELTIINKQLYNSVMSGQPIKVGPHWLVFHSTNNVLGHSTVNVVLCGSAAMLPNYTRPLSQSNNVKGVQFRIPVIHDLRAAIKNMEVMTTKVVTIDHKLYRSLSLRMLRTETTLDDLLAYARVNCHIITYTNKATGQSYIRNPDGVMEACACVYYENKRANDSIAKLTEILTQSYTRKLSFSSVKDVIKAVGLNVLADVTSFFGSKITIDEILNTIENLVDGSASRFIRHLNKFCFVKLTKRIEYPKIVYRIGDTVNSTPSVVNAMDPVLASNMLKAAVGGVYNWYQSIGCNTNPAENYTRRRESCISAMCRKLEQYTGSSKKEAIDKVAKSMLQKYDLQTVVDCVRKLFNNLQDPIELQALPNTLEQLSELTNCDLTPKANIKGRMRHTNYTPEMLSRETNICSWMYEEQVGFMQGKTVLFSTIGSMGDVEPFLGVANWWKKFGIKCIFAIPVALCDHVEAQGHQVLKLNVSVTDLMSACIKMEESKYNLIQLAKHLNDLMVTTSRVFDIELNDWTPILQQVDLIIETPFTHVAAQLAQKFRIPLIISAAYPWEYSRMTSLKMQPCTLFDMLSGAISYTPFQHKLSHWRRTALELTNMRGQMVLLAGNPMLQLHEQPTTVWKLGNCTSVVGYSLQITKDMQEMTAEHLKLFAHNRVVAVCFGSMSNEGFEEWGQEIYEKLMTLFDVIVIVGKRWKLKLSNSEFPVIAYDYINYHYLLPMVDLVVTHGGSGTTHNAIRHGCVVAIKPFFGDQFAWLQATKQLGVGMDTNDMLELDTTKLDKYKQKVNEYVSKIEEYDVNANITASFSYYLEVGRKHIEGIVNDEAIPVNEMMDFNCDRLCRLVTNQRPTKWSDYDDLEAATELAINDVMEYAKHSKVTTKATGKQKSRKEVNLALPEVFASETITKSQQKKRPVTKQTIVTNVDETRLKPTEEEIEMEKAVQLVRQPKSNLVQELIKKFSQPAVSTAPSKRSGYQKSNRKSVKIQRVKHKTMEFIKKMAAAELGPLEETFPATSESSGQQSLEPEKVSNIIEAQLDESATDSEKHRTAAAHKLSSERTTIEDDLEKLLRPTDPIGYLQNTGSDTDPESEEIINTYIEKGKQPELTETAILSLWKSNKTPMPKEVTHNSSNRFGLLDSMTEEETESQSIEQKCESPEQTNKELMESIPELQSPNKFSISPVTSICYSKIAEMESSDTDMSDESNDKPLRNHLNHKWRLKFIRNQVTCIPEINCGSTWNIKYDDWELEYNPETTDTCVYECAKFICRTYGHTKVDNDTVYYWCQRLGIRNKPSMNEAQNLFQLIGLPTFFITDSKKLLLNSCGQVPYIGVQLIIEGGIGHCRIVKLHGVQLLDKVMTERQPTMSKALRDELEATLAPAALTISKVRRRLLCKPENFANWSGTGTPYMLQELQAKLSMRNLRFTLTRKFKPVHFVKWKIVGNVYLADGTTEKLKHGALVLFRRGNEYLAGLIVLTCYGMVMIPMNSAFSDEEVCETVETEIKVMNERIIRKKIIKPPGGLETATCLNEITRSALLSTNPEIVDATINDESASHLFIYEYDGRAHHKYDELDIIKRFHPISIQGVGYDIKAEWLEKLLAPHGAVRYTLQRQRLNIVVEFQTLHQAAVFASVASKSWPSTIQLAKQVVVSWDEAQSTGERWIERHAFLNKCERGVSKEHISWLTGAWMTLDQQQLDTLMVTKEEVENVCGAKLPDLLFRPSENKRITGLDYAFLPPDSLYRLPQLRVLFAKKSIILECKLTKQGGSEELENRVTSKLPDEFNVNKHTRWWDIHVVKPETQFNMELWSNRINTEAIMGALDTGTGPDQLDVMTPEAGIQDHVFIHNNPTEWPEHKNDGMVAMDDLDYQDMAMWHDTDFTDWNEKFGPKNQVDVTSRRMPTEIKTSQKATMVEYPKFSRPVLTKAANQEFNAVTGRLCRRENYRKYGYKLQEEVWLFMNAYFDPTKHDLLDYYQCHQLSLNDGKVLDWLRDRPDANKIAAELELILSEGFEVHPINNINVHLKLESLLKEEPASDLRQVKARALMWQCKGYCAMFSHIFKELKTRLKSLLKPHIIYSDGLRGDELSSMVREVVDFTHFFENDLAQQDRQTDHDTINFEMQIYKLLGANVSVINLWHNCHYHWKYKAASVMGVRDAMRLTGQATTALGNCLTNMLVHRKLVQTIGDQLRLFLVLGDDGLMLTNGHINTESLNRELKSNHNMMCKPKCNMQYGTFCCMLVAKNHLGSATLGPDFVRLRRRFEVTNGVSEANDENLRARSMSYLMFLGNIPEAMELVELEQMPIVPQKWYDYDTMVEAMGIKYGINIDDVENNKNQLLKMIREKKIFIKTIDHWFEGL
ncbi:polyprotein [Fagopyrum esculentum endornavirus 1]|nr:polyprotein [Fagopyrum esculentum endornavirus 1]